ncbi:hypothetical protein HAX54_036946 [Datura stramonium]|uniref:Uncharacterized protein n=1 Tax=Datura stramonium TaxID=4076 RepID=A0ABS8SGQ7_DATST|nr:hypothetical protein [Datura stramonium]
MMQSILLLKKDLLSLILVPPPSVLKIGFMVYCLLKKIKINWADWFLGYMMESCQDFGGNSNLPYGMMISHILKSDIDLSKYPAKKISSTYDNYAFASMDYILLDEKWYKKFKPKLKVTVDKPLFEVTSNVVQSLPLENLLKNAKEIKASFDKT